MKNQVSLFGSVLVALLFTFVMFSCEKDAFEPVELSGPTSENPAYAIIGNYVAQDPCFALGTGYRLLIRPSKESEDEIVLVNFIGEDISLRAFYDKGDFVIPPQIWDNDIEPVTFRLSGEITRTAAAELIISYRLHTGNMDKTCQVIAKPTEE